MKYIFGMGVRSARETAQRNNVLGKVSESLLCKGGNKILKNVCISKLKYCYK